jgi:hypothetical protein
MPSAVVPSAAATCYKVVAVVQGRYISIFDGRTHYKLGEIAEVEGGCFVCPTLTAVLRHATRLPKRSLLLSAPRAIMRVAAWNAYGRPPNLPEHHAPLDDETKQIFSHIQPLEALPYA